MTFNEAMRSLLQGILDILIAARQLLKFVRCVTGEYLLCWNGLIDARYYCSRTPKKDMLNGSDRCRIFFLSRIVGRLVAARCQHCFDLTFSNVWKKLKTRYRRVGSSNAEKARGRRFNVRKKQLMRLLFGITFWKEQWVFEAGSFQTRGHFCVWQRSQRNLMVSGCGNIVMLLVSRSNFGFFQISHCTTTTKFLGSLIRYYF